MANDALSKYFAIANKPGFNRQDMTSVKSAMDQSGVVANPMPLKAAQGRLQLAQQQGGDVTGATAEVARSVTRANQDINKRHYIPGASSLPHAGMGGGASGGAFGTGGIGSNPFGGGLGANTTMQPRSVETQIANRPAYQRNRVTTGQMGEMNRANQDRFRAEQGPLTTAFNRSFSQADAQQRMNDTAVNDAASSQFFGLMNGYNQQQQNLNQQGLMPLLSQLFGGF